MKAAAIFFTLLIFTAIAAPVLSLPAKAESGSPKVDICPMCVSFLSNTINELLEIIANSGVLGTCGALCSQLPNQLESVVCNLLCDYVGITAFVDLIDEVDPDPIYYCEELSVCPVNMNAAGQILSAEFTPPSGPAGTKFQLNIAFNVTNKIGTGELAFDINPPPPGFDFGDAALLVGTTGMQKAQFSFTASPSEQEPFNPGVYKTEVALCEGSCGSTHPYTKTLSTANTQFSITN